LLTSQYILYQYRNERAAGESPNWSVILSFPAFCDAN
jgi:hypothetical protein